MTITLAATPTPPGVLPSSPVNQVGKTFTAATENALSQAIPVDHNAVPGDLLVVWLASGSPVSAAGVSDIGYFPRPLTYVTRKFGDNTPGKTVYLDLFYTTIQEGEAGGQLGITWDFGGFDACFAMVARLYHGHNTDAPIGSFGNGENNGATVTVAHCGYIDVPEAGCLVDSAVAFNAETSVGTTVLGDTATKAQEDVAGFMPGLALHTGLLDFAYPYRWGGNNVSAAQGGPAVNVGGCGMSLAINPMPRPGPIAFGLANDDTHTPIGTYLDVTDLRAAWTYTRRSGQGPQVGWLIARERPDGSDQGFWNTTLDRWVADPFVNSDDMDSFVWPDGAFTNDLSTWLVYGAIVEGEQFLVSEISVPWTFTARAAPVVTVTAPYGTLGAIPTVAWTVDQVGTSYEVRIFDLATYTADGFDPYTASPVTESGVVASAGTTWTPSALRGGGYYRAYVRVQKDNQWSAFATADFFAAYAPQPATPTLAAVTDLDTVTGAPRVKLTVTGHDTVGGGLDNTTYANVLRYDVPTQTWVPVRFATDVVLPWPGQVVTLYDYEAPPSTTVANPTRYQAQVYSTKPAPHLTLDDATFGLLDTAGNPLG